MKKMFHNIVLLVEVATSPLIEPKYSNVVYFDVIDSSLSQYLDTII